MGMGPSRWSLPALILHLLLFHLAVRSGLVELTCTVGAWIEDFGSREANVATDRTADLTLRDRGTRSRIRQRIERLGPYQSLILLAVPTSIVEPLKLVAVAVMGEGHWLSGTLVIIAAYATSMIAIERLFLIVKPKLLTLNWFSRLWTWIIRLRVVKWLKVVKQAIFGWIGSVWNTGLRSEE